MKCTGGGSWENHKEMPTTRYTHHFTASYRFLINGPGAKTIFSADFNSLRLRHLFLSIATPNLVSKPALGARQLFADTSMIR